MRLASAIAVLLTLVLTQPVSAQSGVRDNRLGEADSLFAEAMRLWPGGPTPQIEDLLKRALANREAALGPADPTVAQVRDQLGRYQYNLRHYDRAAVLFQQAAEIQEVSVGKLDLVLAAYLGDLGAAQREEGHHDEAEATVLRSLAIRRSMLPADDPLIAASLNNLGRNYLAQTRGLEAAEAVGRPPCEALLRRFEDLES
jgi:tetratricopeptide (TPR) repeat protein